MSQVQTSGQPGPATGAAISLEPSGRSTRRSESELVGPGPRRVPKGDPLGPLEEGPPGGRVGYVHGTPRLWPTEKLITPQPSGPQSPASDTTRPGPEANFPWSLVAGPRPSSAGEARQLPRTDLFRRRRPTEKLISPEPSVRSTPASNTSGRTPRGTRLPKGVSAARSVSALLIFSRPKTWQVAPAPDGRPRRSAPRRARGTKRDGLLPPGVGHPVFEAGLRGPGGSRETAFFGGSVRPGLGGAPPTVTEKLISRQPSVRQSPASTSTSPAPGGRVPPGLVPVGRRGAAREASPWRETWISAPSRAEKINDAKTDRAVHSSFGRRVASGVGP